MLPINPDVVAAIRELRATSPLARLVPWADITTQFPVLKPFALEDSVTRAGPKQIAFTEAFMARAVDGNHKSVYSAIGANRSGKTYTAGWLCFSLFLREHAKDGDMFWCVAQNLNRSIDGQQRELWEALPRHMFGTHAWDKKLGFGGHCRLILRCKGGTCVVEFRSADQDPNTFEQAKLRGAWIDEACPEWLLDRLLARIIDLDGFLLFSDIRHQWWQEQRLIAPPPPQDKAVYCQQFCMRDNELNLPAGAIDRARETMTADEARMRIDGESGLMEGLVFKSFSKRQIIRPFQIPDFWPKWRVIDYGSSAPTACLWIAISEDEEVYVYREYYEVSPSVAHSASMILGLSPPSEEYRATMIDPHAKDKPPAVYGMAPSVGDQFRDAGIVTVGWPYIQTMGEHACVERIKFRDERGTVKVFETCTNHIRERRNWKHKCDKNGKPVAADAYENENSHSVDCLKGFLASNPTYTPRTIDVVRK